MKALGTISVPAASTARASNLPEGASAPRPLLPLFLTKEGGEGWGEEEFSSNTPFHEPPYHPSLGLPRPEDSPNPTSRIGPLNCSSRRESALTSSRIQMERTHVRCYGRPAAYRKLRRAFTLIELMVVVGIMGLILAAGIPSLYKLWQKEGMRKVTSEVLELCGKARAQAILGGKPTDLVFYPLEHRITISGGGGGVSANETPPSVGAASGQSVTIPEDFSIEMLDINLSEYRESEWARVRFYADGMSDELTFVLRSPKNEYKKITTEVTTGLASVDDVVR
jgi:prepilin-type N-terminal cleavage/methylation domain-containing protein